MTRWVRSSRCGGGHCVEVAWVKSSSCSDHACVEVADAGGRVLLRDGKLGDASPVIEFDRAGWRAFLQMISTSPEELS